MITLDTMSTGAATLHTGPCLRRDFEEGLGAKERVQILTRHSFIPYQALESQSVVEPDQPQSVLQGYVWF
jgi:hypothetical protein